MSDVQDYLSNPIVTGVAGAIGGAAAGYIVGRTRSSRRKSSFRRHSHSKKRNSRKSKKHYRTTPYTARKRPDTSTRRIRYTKKGQPYVIQYKLINGHRRKMARFIKKSSAHSSYKRKGGRY